MKYKLYRSFGNLDKDIRRHELVAVEYGMNLEAVTDALIRAVSDDLAGTPEYANYETAAFAPEPVRPITCFIHCVNPSVYPLGIENI